MENMGVLRTLILVVNKITDAGLVPLQGLTSLRAIPGRSSGAAVS